MKDVVITPKIEIIEYSIDSSINKNKSILSAAAGQDGFDKFSNSNYSKINYKAIKFHNLFQNLNKI